jgi:hypothetical protein
VRLGSVGAHPADPRDTPAGDEQVDRALLCAALLPTAQASFRLFWFQSLLGKAR